MGGFFNMSGLAPQSLIGPNFAIGRAIYFRKIGRGGEGFFEFPAYLCMSFEMGNPWERRGGISFGSARPSKVAHFPVGANSRRSSGLRSSSRQV